MAILVVIFVLYFQYFIKSQQQCLRLQKQQIQTLLLEQHKQFGGLIFLCVIEPQLGYKSQINEGLNQQNQFGEIIVGNSNQSFSILSFINQSATYRKGLQFCLKNINLKIQSGKKVSIVGRTGAGKSSLFNSILRIIEPAQGQLIIQGKEIRDYAVDTLRSQITIIEQNPSIIDGTIRQNIDPNNIYTDNQINQKLGQCKLADLLEKKGGLYKCISNKTTSAGENQLVSFCRAVLKNSNLILMDEATAKINAEWNEIIQQIIYRHFRERTVPIIAHKLSTLERSDYIIVLNEGEVVEQGATLELLENPNSFYRNMLESNSKDLLA